MKSSEYVSECEHEFADDLFSALATSLVHMSVRTGTDATMTLSTRDVPKHYRYI